MSAVLWCIGRYAGTHEKPGSPYSSAAHLHYILQKQVKRDSETGRNLASDNAIPVLVQRLSQIPTDVLPTHRTGWHEKVKVSCFMFGEGDRHT